MLPCARALTRRVSERPEKAHILCPHLLMLSGGGGGGAASAGPEAQFLCLLGGVGGAWRPPCESELSSVAGCGEKVPNPVWRECELTG